MHERVSAESHVPFYLRISYEYHEYVISQLTWARLHVTVESSVYACLIMATPRATPSTVTVDSTLLVPASTSSLDLIRESFEKEEGYAVAFLILMKNPA